MSNNPRRCHKGIKLIARKGNEYYFVDSIFEHDNSFAGCTGIICCPISEKYAEELLSPDSVGERYEDYWHEKYSGEVQEDCPNCEGEVQKEGCEECNYPSLSAFCAEIIQFDGINAMIDYLGDEYVDALVAIGEDAVYAECMSCGRIFSNYGCNEPMTPDYFDRIYDKEALVAILAFEDGAVSYEYVAKVVFGK